MDLAAESCRRKALSSFTVWNTAEAVACKIEASMAPQRQMSETRMPETKKPSNRLHSAAESMEASPLLLTTTAGQES
jgi:hypothetical protein